MAFGKTLEQKNFENEQLAKDQGLTLTHVTPLVCPALTMWEPTLRRKHHSSKIPDRFLGASSVSFRPSSPLQGKDDRIPNICFSQHRDASHPQAQLLRPLLASENAPFLKLPSVGNVCPHFQRWGSGRLASWAATLSSAPSNGNTRVATA